MDVTAANPHAAIDRRNRQRDRLLASLIRQQPEIIGSAQRNLRDWARHWGRLSPAWQEWDQVLRMLTPAQVADFLESATPMANRLRQSSPFLGVLTEPEGGKRTAPADHAA